MQLNIPDAVHARLREAAKKYGAVTYRLAEQLLNEGLDRLEQAQPEKHEGQKPTTEGG